ncbi:DEAD/DEAH box helicase [Microbacterium sp.]|uniref:DEAD/DEAH box helicase n=1 Tax=Microbacterium sp. TaxID=51671 RepID=UPI00334261D3
MTPSGDAGRQDWRRILGATRPASEGSTALALGVELRVREPDPNPWAARRAVAAEPRRLASGPAETLLAVRPLVRSDRTGAWVQSGVGWDGIRSEVFRFAPAQRRWFSDLLALSRDSLLSGTAGDWLPLDHVESDLFFPHLRRAQALGIPLVATRTHTDLAIAAEAAAGLELVRDDHGIRVEARVIVDGERVEHCGPIGQSGVYSWALVGQRLRVVLGEVALTPASRAVIAEGGAVRIPAEDEEGFFALTYPRLARQQEVLAGTGVTLPRRVTPEALLSVSFREEDVLDFRWGWEYPGLGRFPLAPTDDAVRDAEAESAVRARFERTWAACDVVPFAPAGVLREADAAEFMTRVVPAMEGLGVEVVVTGTVRDYEQLTGDPEITVSTVESTDPDWFDLGFLVRIDGRSIPFQPLFSALSQRRKKMLLADGGWFSLAHPALDRLRELIDEAASLAEWETGPKIARDQLALWEDFEDLADEAVPAVTWRAAVDALRSTEHVPERPAPVRLQARLRPYQQAGYEWLSFLREHRLGGILADDMGLGKTVQVLAMMLDARERGEERPFLVVAPTSVLGAWREQAQEFAPSLTAEIVEKARRGAVRGAADRADLVIVSYTVMRLAAEDFAGEDWAVLILDEAQFVKNPASLQHRAVAGVPAEVTFAVTGTPLENSLADLWALLQLTSPGLFPSARRFRQEYIHPIEQGKVPENAEGSGFRAARIARLRRRVRPLMLRRTKDVVAADLPPKQEQVLHVELGHGHRALYDTVLQRERQKVLGLLEDLDRNRFIVFRSLTLLRMLSLAPGLIDAEDAGLGSRKLDVLIERLTELRAEGHRALVFSQFTSYLDLAEERLAKAGITFRRLDGSTRRRSKVIEEFRQGDDPVFLISLKAGGFGLTLTEADYVFLLDPWWNPAAETQAVDRTHRIGQEDQVFVYRLIATGTIEEKVLALQQRKARLFTAVMDDEDLFAQTLTADDIRALFDP